MKKKINLIPVFMVLFVVFGLYFIKTYSAFEIRVENKILGYVKNKSDINESFKIANELANSKKVNSFLKEEYEVTPKFVMPRDLISNSTLGKRLYENLKSYENVWVLYKSDEKIAGIYDRDKALDTLSNFKSSFLKKDDIKEDNSHKLIKIKRSVVKDINFLEDIKFQFESFPSEKIITAEKLRDLLINETAKTKVLLGEATKAIGGASRFEVVIPKNLSGVYLIKNSKLSFDVNYKTYDSENITLPKSTIFRYDETIDKGEVIVEREGENGILYREVEKEFINDTLVKSHIEKEEVIHEPTSQIVRVGDKSILDRPVFKFPVKGVITSPYGPRFDGFHRGVDISSNLGAEIHAAKSGEVTFAGFRASYGYLVIISHSNGYETRYAHLLTLNVSKGDTVRTGDVIGKMGSSGNSTGAHVHFEVLKDGQLLDPEEYLR